MGGYDGSRKKSKTLDEKRFLSVEETYQRKTPMEHVLLRPDSYVGSTEPVTAVSAFLHLKCGYGNGVVLHVYTTWVSSTTG